MSEPLDLPDAVHEQFPSPPLKVMLGQVRFPAILKVADPAGLAGFQEEIRQEYPQYGFEQQLSLAVTPSGMSTAGEEKNSRFVTADGAWSVILNPTFITLEASVATKYSNFADFRERFSQIWEIASRLLGPTAVVQQGLRYIDFFDWPDVGPAEWGRYINPHLLGLLAADELAALIDHTLADTTLNLSDEMMLSLKHGLVRSGPEGERGFYMDTDCMSRSPQDDISADAILARFDVFHGEIHKLFHWAITDDARERFRAVPTSD